MTALLRLDEAVGRYGAVKALHPLTLEISAGSRHAIIGPNGAGKTTLLNLAAGTLQPDSGRIVFDGHDITRDQPATRARHGIGRTFQHPGTFDALTVAEHLSLAQLHRTDRSRSAAAALLEQVGLAGHTDTPAGRLSYGQRRLLEIATVLAGRPRLLLLDEPSPGLDPADLDRLTTVLTGLPRQVTVILVDHRLPLVFALADTITVLHHGRHLATGTPDEIRADPQVRDAYLTPTSHRRATEPATESRPPLLTIRGLRAGYHGADVLNRLDLQVTDGTVHAILGRNGAGKTTLLNTIAGLHPRRGGTILLDGTDLHPDPRRRDPGGGIAIVAQGRRLFAELTGHEHLTLAARRRRSDTRWSLDDILDLLPPLRDVLHRRPAQLSGGQQQMLALAQAVLAGPRLLLLDEPTEGLAPAVVDQLRDVLTQLAATGLTVLLAEQHLAFALDVAQQVTILEHGHARYSSTTADLADLAARQQLHTLLGVNTPTTGPAASHSTPITSQHAATGAGHDTDPKDPPR
jgi:branched-chain amino acid transport system ATP-binding protein